MTMKKPALLALLALAAGCGTPTDTPPQEEQSFIALQRDFQTFTTWETFQLAADGTNSLHTGVNRTIYLRSRPASGATKFPVGAMIVKHVDGEGDPNGPRTFAMVKRGGNYNRNGALDWEWFELIANDQATAGADIGAELMPRA
jgi:hypothetical protein